MKPKNNQIRNIRQLIQLFHSYGIQLTGRKKLRRFQDQLKMDEIFVHGLIFEVEYLLQKEIEGNWEDLNCPKDVIERALIEN
ncbi:hypothetical protein ADIS_2894 [Lunatimonas lonarensis]|jgi:hypothetical protein|uniref:Acyl carrier protein n=1 Tax=Lunatimonas lonarensis TaxID=1232681 RepID=R7ZR02_9BACT|nr:hypothetical protein [Lunatimonas lonarensis]EON76444.1 hypothetical protein ADIS_2894 [Lunatimonas lonarensis]